MIESKKNGSRAGVNTLAWLDLWGKTLGYSVLEYSCMPIGELQDLIALYMAREGYTEIREVKNDEKIPVELR